MVGSGLLHPIVLVSFGRDSRTENQLEQNCDAKKPFDERDLRINVEVSHRVEINRRISEVAKKKSFIYKNWTKVFWI
jgi:hypothetical protein